MSKRYVLPAENERVGLRLLEKEDLPLTLSWRNQDSIRRWFLNSNVIDEKDHFTWFDKYVESDNDFVFIVIARDMEDLSVGQVSLYNINWNVASAEFGRLMIGHSVARGKGYAKQASQLLLKIGFEQLALKEIHLEVKENNLPAQKIYIDCGFIETGRENQLIHMKIMAPKSHKI